MRQPLEPLSQAMPIDMAYFTQADLSKDFDFREKGAGLVEKGERESPKGKKKGCPERNGKSAGIHELASVLLSLTLIKTEFHTLEKTRAEKRGNELARKEVLETWIYTKVNIQYREGFGGGTPQTFFAPAFPSFSPIPYLSKQTHKLRRPPEGNIKNASNHTRPFKFRRNHTLKKTPAWLVIILHTHSRREQA